MAQSMATSARGFIQSEVASLQKQLKSAADVAITNISFVSGESQKVVNLVAAFLQESFEIVLKNPLLSTIVDKLEE
ncbi:hypothetical protein EC988_001053 [Linderina pennispora]|nr:hypothetical protein EC988_001053 [Linderina pennispora]